MISFTSNCPAGKLASDRAEVIKSKVDKQRADEAALELVNRLIAVWEAEGAPIGDPRVHAIATTTIRRLQAAGSYRAAERMRELLEPFDPTDDGVMDTYRELVERGGTPSVEAKTVDQDYPAQAVRGFSKNRSRFDNLAGYRWFRPKIIAQIAAFNLGRAKAMKSATKKLHIAKKLNTVESRAIGEAVKDFCYIEADLFRESLAGNGAHGIREWHHLSALLKAWKKLNLKWLVDQMKAAVALEKATLLALRPPRGKTVRIDGVVTWVKRRGRPRKPMPRGTYNV